MLIEAFRKLAQAITKPGTPEAAFFDAACDEMAESRRRFDERQARIDQSIRRGARLTDHRFRP
ncbi:hypothetical protein M5E06_17815 [Azospirillum sp. A1-3]|uniref:hypothetical protein n=1 Tax=Azospirillum sp. A1-3 TaxID=185874 RepID=UPI002076F206|nr:hypothetical protein [Azospirillum sp. A1-3]MCM8735993.1 hypothetical protein [Azospirillum sp. A1-3]